MNLIPVFLTTNHKVKLGFNSTTLIHKDPKPSLIFTILLDFLKITHSPLAIGLKLSLIEWTQQKLATVLVITV